MTANATPNDVTAPSEARAQSLATIVEQSAGKRPGAPAVSFRDRTWHYGELVAAARAVASGLHQLDVKAGDRLAFCGVNSDRYVISWLATQMLGAIHVPINYSLGAREIGYILDHCQAKMAFADASLAPVVGEAVVGCDRQIALAGLLGIVDEPWHDFDRLLEAGGEPPPYVPGFEDVAQIAYTSGTESRPKGAMLSHHALISQYASCITAGSYSNGDVVLNMLPLYHCAQMHCFLMPHLWLGAHNVLLQSADITEMLGTIERYGVSSVFAPPTVWIGILRHPDFSPQRFATVKKAYYGASIMPIEIIRELIAVLPEMSLWNYYGQTELGPLAACLPPAQQLTHPGAAGLPVLNVETMVVDDDMRPVAVGEVGEIVHRSSQLLTGYFRDPRQTEAAFKGGWFHSGDLAVQDPDGYLTIVDRKKDMINSGGENISSREVEEVLYEHPDVQEAAVVATPHEKWIEAVCAVIVRRPGSVVTEDQLIEFSRTRLAGFKVPKRVVFAHSLPKSPSGKVLKRELRVTLVLEPE
jgi:fatty-acyl-CoA synthase